MQLFQEVIDECGFMDLGYVGLKFTWVRHFENGNSIWERLDRGLATNWWFLKFPGSRVHHLHCDSLDHSPLLVVLAPLDIPTRKKYSGLRRCGCQIRLVKKQYKQHGAQWQVQTWTLQYISKVEKCGKDLLWWNRNVFGSVRQELIKKK